jgi:hypothetical protein
MNSSSSSGDSNNGNDGESEEIEIERHDVKVLLRFLIQPLTPLCISHRRVFCLEDAFAVNFYFPE